MTMGLPMHAPEDAADDSTATSLSPLAQAALEAIPEGVVSIDAADRVVAYNNSFCELWGLGLRLGAGARLPDLLAMYSERLGSPAPSASGPDEDLPPSGGRELFRLANGRILEKSCTPQVTGARPR